MSTSNGGFFSRGEDDIIPASLPVNIDLIHGDCFPLLEKMDDGSVDIVLSDPPYSTQTHDGARTGSWSKKESPSKLLTFDSLTPEQFVLFAKHSVRLAKRWVITFCDWKYAHLLEEVGLIRLGVWCLSGGTMVYARTSKGDRPLSVRDITRIKSLEDVKLWNGERWTQVTGWALSDFNGSAMEIKLRSGEKIGCTPDHLWPTVNRGVVRTADLKPGDVLAKTILPEPDDVTSPGGLDDELIGWFIGTYIADGSRSGDTIQISGHVDEIERYDKLKKIAELYHGQCRRYQYKSKGITDNLHGKILNAIIDMYVSGRDAKSKYPSGLCWQRSNTFLRSLLEGYLEGDGHYDHSNDRWRLGFTENRWLESSLRTLCARLGYGLRLKSAWAQYNDKLYPMFRGELRKRRNKQHPNYTEDSEVMEIRTARWERNFYDIGVKDDPHTFSLASGVLTHNCKPNPAPQMSGDRPSTGWEAIAILHRPGRKKWNGGGKCAVWRHNRVDAKYHPSQKPLSLLRELIRLFSNPGEKILDPFAGSAAVGVACMQTSRSYLGIEKDAKFFGIAQKRLARRR